MKDFWQDMFYDLERMDEEAIADLWGGQLRNDFDSIKEAIESYDLIKALAIIEDCKSYY